MIVSALKFSLPVLCSSAKELLLPCSCAASVLQKREMGKHWDPQFRRLRAKKWLKVELPDYDEIRRDAKLAPDEIRARLKEKGVAPIRQWSEKPIFLGSTGEILDPFVPPEGDGKISSLTKTGAKQRMQLLTKKGASFMAVRKIKNFEDNFDLPKLAEELQDTFVLIHETLAKKDEDELHDMVTERCFPEMMMNVKGKTIRWKFIKSLEAPCIVQVRCTDVVTKENVFAQVTLRMHSQQTLAVYDRFGRLSYGSEVVVKDVLEYVVFEKHLADIYGKWRIHGKIVPDWMPPKDAILRTTVKETVAPEPTDEATPDSTKEPSAVAEARA